MQPRDACHTGEAVPDERETMTQPPDIPRSYGGPRSAVAAHPVTSAVIAILIIAAIFFSLYVPLYASATPKVGQGGTVGIEFDSAPAEGNPVQARMFSASLPRLCGSLTGRVVDDPTTHQGIAYALFDFLLED